MEKIQIYSVGACSASACVDNSCSIEEVAAELNRQYPTGILNDWAPSMDEYFADGVNTNPCPCQTNPETRKHYLFNC